MVRGDDSESEVRPLALVEWELQARIEAETATRFRERRRAAKLARRIAALPPTLFQNEIVDNAGPDAWNIESDTWNARSMQSSSNFVDLPSIARNEATTSKWVAVAPAQSLDGVAPSEPVGEADPSPRKRRGRRRAAATAPGEAEAAPADPIVRTAVEVVVPEVVPEAVVPEVVEPELVVPAPIVVEPVATEPVTVEPTPKSPRRRRGRLVRAEASEAVDARSVAPGPGVEVEPGATREVMPEVTPEVAAPVEPEVAAEPDPEPEPVAATAPPVEPPTPPRRAEPRPPVITTSWERSNPAWTNRVFPGQRGARTETVTWPRPRPAAPPVEDIAAESRAESIADNAKRPSGR